MRPLSYSGYRFPPEIIQRAVWMYLRFTLSFRDVEELLAERGIVVTYESIRRWVLTFGPAIARKLRARRPKPHGRCWGGRPPIRHRYAKVRSFQISREEAVRGTG